jgi:hypothetical protein
MIAAISTGCTTLSCAGTICKREPDPTDFRKRSEEEPRHGLMESTKEKAEELQGMREDRRD